MKQTFAPHGLLALAPQAFGQLFDICAPEACQVAEATVAVLTIRGPLMQHRTWEGDSYEAIKMRVAFALASSARAIVLAIDSPGGLVAGCFETAAEIREMARAAGKTLHAYVQGQCCSAAYAFACACSTIHAPATAIVGSIGVIDCVLDATAADRSNGLKFALIASGARKTDGNPHNALTDETIAAAQARVDDLAAVFFAFVGESRALSVDAVRQLNADTFTGARAQALQLVDGVMTLDALVSSLTINPQGLQAMADKKDDDPTMIALLADANGDDPKKAARAKRMIAAWATAEDDDKPKDKDGEEASSDSEEEDDDAPPKKKDDAPAAAAAVTAPAAQAPAAVIDPAVQALAEVHTLRSDMAKKERAEERRKLIASRPDFSAELVAVLRDPKRTPLATVRHMVETLPKGPAQKTPVEQALAAATSAAAPTVGGNLQGGVTTTDESAELDRRMGLQAVSTQTKIIKENGTLTFKLANYASPAAEVQVTK